MRMSMEEEAAVEEPQRALVPQTAEEPQRALKPTAEEVPQTALVPQSAFVPQSALLPQIVVPHSAFESEMAGLAQSEV